MTSTQQFMAGKDQYVALKLDGLIIKHYLHSAGLDIGAYTTIAAQMVSDRPQWKAFISRQPTPIPEQGSKDKQIHL